MKILGRAISLAGIIPLLAAANGVDQPGAGTRGAIDPALAAELEAIDRRVEGIRDLTTEFEEQKFSSLLKKPLVSHGRLRVVGARSRWDTSSPQRTSMVVDAAGIRIYYPERSTVEVYQVDEKLKWLAVSALPKLSLLAERFTIERAPVTDVHDTGSIGRYLGLRLHPKDEAVGKYLRRVDLVLNTMTAFVVRVEMLDVDGDRTVILFSNTRANTGLDDKDVDLAVPANTRVVRPLAQLEKEPPADSP